MQARHGADAVGVFGSGALTNEKAYLLGKFARVALGTSNIDYNGRFCMSSAAAAATRAFGLDRGLPFPLEDIAHANVVLLRGTGHRPDRPGSRAAVPGRQQRAPYINIALTLGQVGTRFGGDGTITGQGNGQGGREHGQKADHFPVTGRSTIRWRAATWLLSGMSARWHQDAVKQSGIFCYRGVVRRLLGAETA